jgi:hypothetical protein
MIKLTDEKCITQNNTQWGKNVTHTAPGTGELCTRGWIHCYESIKQALLMNPIHANFQNPRAWECSWSGRIKKEKLKIGVQSLTTLKEIKVLEITIEQRVRFAICCALQVYQEESFCRWANNWLLGIDSAAEAAAWAARDAAGASAWAASAAEAAAWAARDVVMTAAWAARAAARASAWAASTAEAADINLAIDFAFKEPWK